MRRVGALTGLVVGALLTTAAPAPVVAQVATTVLCVTVAGDPPTGSWGAGSLSAAIATGAATIEQVADRGACAASTPTVAPGTIISGVAGGSSDPFPLTAGDHRLFWTAFEDEGVGCKLILRLVEVDGSVVAGGTLEAELGPGAMGSALADLHEVPAGTYRLDGTESSCSWAVSIT